MVCISQDSFYRELDNAEKAKADKGLFNFDHPSAFDETQVLKVLKDILAGKKVVIPVYDYRNNAQWVDFVSRIVWWNVSTEFIFHTHTHRSPDTQMTIYPADVVLFEGILVFYFPAIRDLFHMKLFVDTDSDTRLSRRGKCTLCSSSLLELVNKFVWKCVCNSCTRYHWTWQRLGTDPYSIYDICEASFWRILLPSKCWFVITVNHCIFQQNNSIYVSFFTDEKVCWRYYPERSW